MRAWLELCASTDMSRLFLGMFFARRVEWELVEHLKFFAQSLPPWTLRCRV